MNGIVTVTTPAESYDLVSLAPAKIDLKVTGNSSDARLSACITQASDAVAQYCNRVLVRETVAEAFRMSRCSAFLILSRVPVATIDEVVENATTLSADDYEHDAESGVLWRLRGTARSHWPAGAIVATYAGGYALSAVPGSIRRAVLILVRHYMTTNHDALLRSEEVEGAGRLDYAMHPDGMLPEVAALLAPHRLAAV